MLVSFILSKFIWKIIDCTFHHSSQSLGKFPPIVLCRGWGVGGPGLYRPSTPSPQTPNLASCYTVFHSVIFYSVDPPNWWSLQTAARKIFVRKPVLLIRIRNNTTANNQGSCKERNKTDTVSLTTEHLLYVEKEWIQIQALFARHHDALFNFCKTCQMSRPSPNSTPWPALRPRGLLGVTQSLPAIQQEKIANILCNNQACPTGWGQKMCLFSQQCIILFVSWWEEHILWRLLDVCSRHEE